MRSWRQLVEAVCVWLSENSWLAGSAIAASIVIFIAVALVVGLGQLSGTSHSTDETPTLVSLDSSWVSGEPSLMASLQFVAIEAPAEQLALQRETARANLLVAIDARKKAAKEHARRAALEAYRRALALALARRRAALAAYHRALLANARKRALQLADLRRKEAAYRKALADYERKLRVSPGAECSLPDVRQYFDCQAGRLPSKPLPRARKH